LFNSVGAPSSAPTPTPDHVAIALSQGGDIATTQVAENAPDGPYSVDIETMSEAAAHYESAPIFSSPAAQLLYSSDDEARLSMSAVLAKRFMKQKRKAYKTKTNLISAEISYLGSDVVALATSEVRAPLNHCAAYGMGFSENYFKKIDGEVADVIALRTVQRVGRHRLVSCARYMLPSPLANREAVVVNIYQKISDDAFLISVTSCEHADCPVSEDFVRIRVVRSFRCSRITPTLTKLEVVNNVHLGGFIPGAIIKVTAVPLSIATPLKMVRFFAAIRTADAVEEADAKELGQIFYEDLSPFVKKRKELRSEIAKVFVRTTILRTAQAKYECIDEMVYRIMRNKLVKSKTRFKANSFSGITVNSSLQTLSRSDAGRIGRSLSNLLLYSMTAEGAVDEWILAFPALGELDTEYRWFRPFMRSVAVALMKNSIYGLITRAYLGALFSVLDMVSDVYVIYQYVTQGRMEYAVPLILMLCLSISCQLLLVWVQYSQVKENRLKHLFLNWVYVLTFLKPGIDAYRVISGNDRLPGAAGNALLEFTWSRNCEMFTEALPGFVLQVIAFLATQDKSRGALMSILISVASASLVSTNTTYEIDVNPEFRQVYPFLGMIPDTGRGKAFFLLFALSYLQIVTKGVSVALLAVTNSNWLVLFLATDMGVLFAYKLARQDFLTWHPLPKFASIVFSTFMRLTTKTIADFAGTMDARHSDVLGGIYFMYSMFQNQVSVLVAVGLYNKYAVAKADALTIDEEFAESDEEIEAGDGSEAKINAAALWAVAISMISLWNVLFVFFLFNICVPEFRSTFWSTKTGVQVSLEHLDESKEDSYRIHIFDKNREHWREFEGDVMKWTLANWERWTDEQPEWFKAEVIELVPDEFIPPRFLRGLGGVNRQRRGSAVDSVRRLSVRRMSGQLLEGVGGSLQ
jgi:hypothetical protein